jgi:hypothetical protein
VTHPEKRALVAAIVAVALVPTSQAVLASLYHGVHSKADTFVGATAFLVFMGGFALFLSIFDACKTLVLKACASAFFFYNVYALVRGQLPPHLFTPYLPLFAALLFIGLFALLFYLVEAEGWRQVAKAMMVSSAVFAFSAPLLAFSEGHAEKIEPAALSARPPPFNNVLILVLDETSPSYTPGIRRALVRAGLSVSYEEVISAGSDTVNALPSMFSVSRHDDVAPCGASALCGKPGFDFSSLQALSPHTDIVGFYHPYCAIKGLRSCHREENFYTRSSAVDFGLSLWCAQFNRGGILSFCKPRAFHMAEIERTRRNMLEKVDAALFWQEGGLLFVHLPIPHPSMTYEYSSLKSEYEGNIVQAEQLVSRLAHKLQVRFGDDFQMLVTSDHPLRTAFWCRSPKYARPGCADGLPAERTHVPLIFASPKPVPFAMPASNVGLLLPYVAR